MGGYGFGDDVSGVLCLCIDTRNASSRRILTSMSIDVCGIDRRMMDQEIPGDARAHAHTSSQAFTITSPRLILVLALTDTSVYVRMHGHRCVNLVTDA